MILQQIQERIHYFAMDNYKVANAIFLSNEGFDKVRADLDVLKWGSIHEGKLTHLYGLPVYVATIDDTFKIGYMQ